MIPITYVINIFGNKYEQNLAVEREVLEKRREAQRLREEHEEREEEEQMAQEEMIMLMKLLLVDLFMYQRNEILKGLLNVDGLRHTMKSNEFLHDNFWVFCNCHKLVDDRYIHCALLTSRVFVDDLRCLMMVREDVYSCGHLLATGLLQSLC